jgi:hypothetical protein
MRQLFGRSRMCARREIARQTLCHVCTPQAWRSMLLCLRRVCVCACACACTCVCVCPCVRACFECPIFPWARCHGPPYHVARLHDEAGARSASVTLESKDWFLAFICQLHSLLDEVLPRGPTVPSEAALCNVAGLLGKLTAVSVSDLFEAAPAGLLPGHRALLVARSILQPFGNRAIAAAISAPPALQCGQISNVAVSMLSVFWWLVSGSATPAHRRLEVLQLLLSQEIYEPGQLHPRRVGAGQEPFSTMPLFLRATHCDTPIFGAGGAAGGTADLGLPVPASAPRAPGVHHVAACVRLCRKGEHLDKVRPYMYLALWLWSSCCQCASWASVGVVRMPRNGALQLMRSILSLSHDNPS